jgi:hypothetical protein
MLTNFKTPLGLTERQRHLVNRAALAVPPAARDEFTKAVTAQLPPEPADAAVVAAINAQLDRMRATPGENL